MRIFILVFNLALSTSAFALGPNDCTFYAPYDGSFDAIEARGSAKATVKGAIQFVPGIRGHGILVGAPETGLTYSTRGNLDLESGSISVWVKPETWDDTDAAMRFFVSVNEGATKSPADGGTFLWLYRFFSRTTYFLVWDSRGYAVLASGDADFRKGEWVHLVGAWNGDELRFFINGKFQGSSRVSTSRILRSLADTFSVGDPNRANAADTVLDELRIFDRALTQPEAEALYRFELFATPAQQSLTVVPLPGAKKVRVDINAIAHKPSEASGLSAAISIKPKEGERVLLEQKVGRFDTNRAAIDLSTASLAVGRYRIVSRLTDNGKELGTAEASFAINTPPKWLGSNIGFTDKVPDPWTPLRLRNAGGRGQKSATEVECWGPRRYAVGDHLFPSRLYTASRNLLAAPMSLTGNANGNVLHVKNIKCEWTKKSLARVEYTCVSQSSVLDVRTVNALEYDGLLWTNLHLARKSPLKIARLSLDIPLRKESATLMNTGFGLETVGALRPWKHRVTSGAQVWLGNEEGGLQVTIPSARNWRTSDRDRQIEIIPETDRVILRLNIIDKETVFTTQHTQRNTCGLTFTFGFQLTPVKPHPKGWRMWRITPPEGTPGTCFNPFYTEGWALGTSYPVPKPEWERIYNEATKKGTIATIYLQPYSIWAGMPDYPDFAAEWRTSYCNPPAKPDPNAPPMSFMGVCPKPRSWGDYFVTTFCDLYQGRYKDMGWGAVYFDNTPTPACDNADHGCGYVDEFGVRQPEAPYFEHREVQRRFYVAMQERWPDKLLFNHESGHLNMMQLGFANGMIDGEHLTLALPPDNFNYHKILTLDRMRAEFMGHNFGFVPIFLPEFTRAASGNRAVIKHFMEELEPPEVMHLVGLLFLHDILPWDAYSNPSPYFHLWAVQDAFGWGDEVEFLPYWNNKEYVTLSPADPNIVCTIYRRPSKVMLVVMNNTDQDREATLQLNEAKLGVRATSALDAWKAVSYTAWTYKENPQNINVWIPSPHPCIGVEERTTMDSGKLTAQVDKRNFRIFTIP